MKYDGQSHIPLPVRTSNSRKTKDKSKETSDDKSVGVLGAIVVTGHLLKVADDDDNEKQKELDAEKEKSDPVKEPAERPPTDGEQENVQKDGLKQQLEKEKMLRSEAEAQLREVHLECERCKVRLKSLQDDFKKMEEMVCNMLQFKSRIEQLKHEKSSISLAYENKIRKFQSCIASLEKENFMLLNELRTLQTSLREECSKLQRRVQDLERQNHTLTLMFKQCLFHTAGSSDQLGCDSQNKWQKPLYSESNEDSWLENAQVQKNLQQHASHDSPSHNSQSEDSTESLASMCSDYSTHSGSSGGNPMMSYPGLPKMSSPPQWLKERSVYDKKGKTFTNVSSTSYMKSPLCNNKSGHIRSKLSEQDILHPFVLESGKTEYRSLFPLRDRNQCKIMTEGMMYSPIAVNIQENDASSRDEEWTKCGKMDLSKKVVLHNDIGSLDAMETPMDDCLNVDSLSLISSSQKLLVSSQYKPNNNLISNGYTELEEFNQNSETKPQNIDIPSIINVNENLNSAGQNFVYRTKSSISVPTVVATGISVPRPTTLNIIPHVMSDPAHNFSFPALECKSHILNECGNVYEDIDAPLFPDTSQYDKTSETDSERLDNENILNQLGSSSEESEIAMNTVIRKPHTINVTNEINCQSTNTQCNEQQQLRIPARELPPTPINDFDQNKSSDKNQDWTNVSQTFVLKTCISSPIPTSVTNHVTFSMSNIDTVQESNSPLSVVSEHGNKDEGYSTMSSDVQEITGDCVPHIRQLCTSPLPVNSFSHIEKSLSNLNEVTEAVLPPQENNLNSKQYLQPLSEEDTEDARVEEEEEEACSGFERDLDSSLIRNDKSNSVIKADCDENEIETIEQVNNYNDECKIQNSCDSSSLTTCTNPLGEEIIESSLNHSIKSRILPAYDKIITLLTPQGFKSHRNDPRHITLPFIQYSKTVVDSTYPPKQRTQTAEKATITDEDSSNVLKTELLNNSSLSLISLENSDKRKTIKSMFESGDNVYFNRKDIRNSTVSDSCIVYKEINIRPKSMISSEDLELYKLKNRFCKRHHHRHHHHHYQNDYQCVCQEQRSMQRFKGILCSGKLARTLSDSHLFIREYYNPSFEFTKPASIGIKNPAKRFNLIPLECHTSACDLSSPSRLTPPLRRSQRQVLISDDVEAAEKLQQDILINQVSLFPISKKDLKELTTQVAEEDKEIKEEERLLRLLEIVKVEKSGEEERKENPVQSGDNEAEIEIKPEYIGMDGKTKREIHCTPYNRGTADHNLVRRFPGVKAQKDVNSPVAAWRLFFTNEILDEIMKYTNQHIQKICSNYTCEQDDIDKSKIIAVNNNSDNNNNEVNLAVVNRIIKDNEKILSENDRYDLLVSFWNVQGLRGKLQKNSVREFLDSNDIIGITETWMLNLSAEEKNILSQNHSIINSNAQRKSKFGRPARGILMLIKKSLGDIFYQYISEYFIVAIINVESNIKTRWNCLYLGLIVMYLPPSIEKRSVLRVVQNYIERWSFLVQQWLIGGDFNARIGENTDTEFSQNFDNISNIRTSKDKLLNMDGKALLDFVQDSQLIILNGRLKGDIPAEFTFVSPNGKSTVDYIICSEFMIDYCESLSVLENDLSDHFPIQLVLKYYKDIRREKKIEKELHTWSIDYKPSYNKQKLLNEFQNIIDEMLILEEDNKPITNYLRLTTKLEEYRFGKCLSPYKQTYKCECHNQTQMEYTLSQVTNHSEIIKVEEVQNRIKKLKDKSTPGPDMIPNSLIKIFPLELISYLTKQFNEFYNQSIIPDKWNELIFTMIYKKGKREEPSNYRPIALLSNLRKIFTSILADKFNIWSATNNYRNTTQYAFVDRGGTQTALFVLMASIQIQLIKKRHKVFALFLDLEKAYDSISINDLQKKLKKHKADEHLIKMISLLFGRYETIIKQDNNVWPPFITYRGLLQGDPLSPYLFNFYLFDLNKCFLRDEDGIQIDNQIIHSISYADDIVLVAPTAAALRRKIQQITEYLENLKVKINPKKSVIMIFRNGSNLPKKHMCFYIKKEELKIVNEVKFLGITFTPNLSFDKQYKSSITKADYTYDDEEIGNWSLQLSNTEVKSVANNSTMWENQWNQPNDAVFPDKSYIHQLEKIQETTLEDEYQDDYWNSGLWNTNELQSSLQLDDKTCDNFINKEIETTDIKNSITNITEDKIVLSHPDVDNNVESNDQNDTLSLKNYDFQESSAITVTDTDIIRDECCNIIIPEEKTDFNSLQCEATEFNRDFYRLCMVGSTRSLVTSECGSHTGSHTEAEQPSENTVEQNETQITLPDQESKVTVNESEISVIDKSSNNESKMENETALSSETTCNESKCQIEENTEKEMTGKEITKDKIPPAIPPKKKLQITKTAGLKNDTNYLGHPYSKVTIDKLYLHEKTKISAGSSRLMSDKRKKNSTRILYTTKTKTHEQSKHSEDHSRKLHKDSLNNSSVRKTIIEKKIYRQTSRDSHKHNVTNPSTVSVTPLEKSLKLIKLSEDKEKKEIKLKNRMQKSASQHKPKSVKLNEISGLSEKDNFDLEKRLAGEGGHMSVAAKIQELNALIKNESEKSRVTIQKVKAKKNVSEERKDLIQEKKKEVQIKEATIIKKSNIKEGCGTSWVHVEADIDLSDPKARANLLDSMMASSSSSNSETEEEGEDEVLEHKHHQRLHALHRFRRHKKRATDKDAVISFIPRMRASIIDRHDFYYRYGEKEREAVACFDFLDDMSTSPSDVGSCELLGREVVENNNNINQLAHSCPDNTIKPSRFSLDDTKLSCNRRHARENHLSTMTLNSQDGEIIDHISLSDSCAESYSSSTHSLNHIL
ncbi:uncharacterized protein LOC111634044 [Centruroides sculpturatus]|uniref:uncharacterized protein LOC111634044 n=1 Tax=Centruroides sculpturatus TaxID=218467 RepID=UPI000C6CA6C5|nr:uncharacterized protein LOC111634044 [Centruroides sculpturatus]